MNHSVFIISIVQNGLDEKLMEKSGFAANKHGKVLSTESRMTVNKVDDGLAVVYNDAVIRKMKCSTFLATITSMLSKNCPDTIFDVHINFFYDIDGEIDPETMKFLEDLSRLIKAVVDTGKVPNIEYKYGNSRLLNQNAENFKHNQNPKPQEEEDEDDSDEDDDELSEDDIWNALGIEADDEDSELDEAAEIEDPFEFMHNVKKVTKQKDSKEYYGRSRVAKNSKNLKKEVRRHGVIVGSKNDIKKDAKIIKAFLKDFIPGNAEWKKEFRNDILKRWLRMYVISKKKLKSLEKEHRKAVESKAKSKNAKKVMKFTKSLFTIPSDRWSDPTK